MAKIYRKLFLISLLMVIKVSVNAQVLEKVQNAFSGYQNTFQEKTFVHTDKEHYLAGELMWLKVYTVDALTNMKVDLSKIVYVEIIDQDNSAVLQSKIELKNGLGNGSMIIPSTLLSGTYKLRAYSKWMQNFGPDYFFEKQLTLISTLNAPEAKAKKKTIQDVQFFPEGGDFIEGIPNSIGFKVLGADGKGIDLKGVIVDQKNDTVARFQSLKFGMGKMMFTPKPNNSYKLVAGLNKTEIIIKDLPTVKKQGYNLILTDNDSDFLTLTVGTTVNIDQVYLFAHNGKKISNAEAGTVTSGKAVFKIEKAKLGEGISHLTIFDISGRPVAERLYFKRPEQQLKIEATTDLSKYSSRKQITVNLKLKNEKNVAENGDLSVSVRRLDSLQGLDQSNILSYLWLTSELKGTIESPSYYFLNPTKETDHAIDHLLLTQGWRKFTWPDLTTNHNTLLTFLPETQGHLINGTLKGLNGNPMVNNNVYIGIPSNRSKFYASVTDTLGRFVFNLKELYGTNEIVVQTNTRIDTVSKIDIKSPFAERFNTFDFKPIDFKPTLINELQSHSLSTQVQNTYFSEQLKQFKKPLTDTVRFFGKPFKTYHLDDYTRFDMMEDVLREYVSEVFISKNQNNYQIKILGKVDFLNENPLILVDGVPYFNMNKIMEVDPKKIKTLDIIRDRYHYGPAVFEGILNFTSYKTNLGSSYINPNAVVLDYEGMQIQREFYHPKYETEIQKTSRMPDFRNVLYWSPSITTNAQGIGEFSFYTSDLKGTYIGVINGLSTTGVPGVGSFSFEVK